MWGNSLNFNPLHFYKIVEMKGLVNRVTCWLGIWGWIAMVAGASSCKKVDSDPPAVALSLPVDAFSVQGNSEFEIAGVASDNEGLATITATLYETATEVVVQSTSITATGLSKRFSFMMPAGDRYTTTGQYTLRVTAADAAQNLGTALTQINVQELPLLYRGAVWAGDLGAQSYAVHGLDTAGTVAPGPSGVSNVAGLLVDNRNEQLVAVQSTPGWIRAWDLEGFAPLFQLDLPQGTGSETFTGLSMNKGKYYCSLRVPAFLRSYRFDGSPVNDFEQALHPGTAVLAMDDRIYMGLQGVVGSPTKLDAYDATGANLLATQLMDWPAAQILELNDGQLLVCGNLAGEGRLMVLDRMAVTTEREVTLGSAFIGAATANGRAWVLSDQGVQEFFPDNGNLSGLLVTGSYTAIAVDATLNRLFLGGNGVVEVHGGAGNLLAAINGTYGQVQFIDIRYNK